MTQCILVDRTPGLPAIVSTIPDIVGSLHIRLLRCKCLLGFTRSLREIDASQRVCAIASAHESFQRFLYANHGKATPSHGCGTLCTAQMMGKCMTSLICLILTLGSHFRSSASYILGLSCCTWGRPAAYVHGFQPIEADGCAGVPNNAKSVVGAALLPKQCGSHTSLWGTAYG